MLRRAPRQQLQQLEFDPYWVGRGLVYAFVGNRRFVTRFGQRPQTAQAGTPKNQTYPDGYAQGFGSTFGTGTSDSLTGPQLALSEGFRSIVTRYYANGAGGGGFGRIFQASTGTGLDAAEAIYPGSSTRLTYVRFASGGAGQWGLVGGTIVLGSWQTFGVTHDQRALGTPPLLYENGIPGSVFTLSSGSGSYSTGLYNPMFGNRAAGDRGWDGLQAITLIFDHPSLGLTNAEHYALSLNPYQVFKGGLRAVLAAVQGGGGATLALTGTSATGSVGSVGVQVGASRALTGNQASGAVGSVGVSVAATRTLTGTGATGSIGSIGIQVSASRALSGNAASGGVGSVGQTVDASRALSGNQASGGVGNVGLAVDASRALTGVTSSGAVGTVSPTTGAVLSLAGVEATAQTGSVSGSTQTSLALSGNQASSATGSVSPTTGAVVALAGNQATTQVGDVAGTTATSSAIAGNAAIGQVGNVGAVTGTAAALSGVSAGGGVGSVGSVTAFIRALTGNAAVGQVGAISASGNKTAAITGVYAVAGVGTVVVFEPVPTVLGTRWREPSDYAKRLASLSASRPRNLQISKR